MLDVAVSEEPGDLLVDSPVVGFCMKSADGIHMNKPSNQHQAGCRVPRIEHSQAWSWEKPPLSPRPRSSDAAAIPERDQCSAGLRLGEVPSLE